MPPETLEDHSPEEIANGTTEFIQYLEECDSQEVNYTWETLMRGSLLLYDFRNKSSGDRGRIEAD